MIRKILKIMNLSRWKIPKGSFKQCMLLIGFIYFLFMYFFHSSIQLDRREDYSGVDVTRVVGKGNLDQKSNKRPITVPSEVRDDTNDVINHIDLTASKSTDGSINENVNYDREFVQIYKMAKQSMSSYSNVHPKCLKTKHSTKTSSTLAAHPTVLGGSYPSVTNESLPVTSDPSGVHKLINASTSLSEREMRYRNARMPFSEPNVVFSEDDFVFQQVLPSFLVYSAFFDDRPNDFDNLHNGSCVRLLTVSKPKPPPLYCVFDTEEGNNSLYASKAVGYEMCENHGKRFGGFILSCHVPIDLQLPPCVVTIYTVDPESKDFDITRTRGIRVPIRTLTKSYLPEGKVTESTLTNFTACVPPLFGNIDPVKFIEFIEFSLASGINRITFYPLRIKREIVKILEYYALERGVVDIVPWDLPKDYDNRVWYHGQLISVQDCMYRNMALSSYALFIDIDELLVPNMNDSLWELVQTIDSDKRCGFKFLGSYFEPYASVKKNSSLPLSSMVIPHSYHRSAKFDKIRTKCLLKPRSVFEQGIHHISKPIWSNLETLLVDTKVATLHHYKKCKSYSTHTECGGKIKDDSAFKFYSKAIRKASKVIQLMRSRSVL